MLALLSRPLHLQHSISPSVQICIGAFDGVGVVFDGDFEDGDVAIAVFDDDVVVVVVAEGADSVAFDVDFAVDDDVTARASDILMSSVSIEVFCEMR